MNDKDRERFAMFEANIIHLTDTTGRIERKIDETRDELVKMVNRLVNHQEPINRMVVQNDQRLTNHIEHNKDINEMSLRKQVALYSGLAAAGGIVVKSAEFLWGVIVTILSGA